MGEQLTHEEMHEIFGLEPSIWDLIGLEHFALAFLGVALYYLDKLHDALKLKNFSWKIFARRNIISFITSLIAAPLLIIMLVDESMQTIISLKINYVTAPLVGYFSTHIWKVLVKKGKGFIRKKEKEINVSG